MLLHQMSSVRTTSFQGLLPPEEVLPFAGQSSTTAQAAVEVDRCSLYPSVVLQFMYAFLYMLSLDLGHLVAGAPLSVGITAAGRHSPHNRTQDRQKTHRVAAKTA